MTEPNAVVLDFTQAQNGYHKNAEARRSATDAMEAALYDKADWEHQYRKGLAVAYTGYRNAGKGVGESEILAKSDAADKALNRDMADAAAKGMQARLKDLEGERTSLRNLVDFSQAVSGVGS